MPAELAHNGRDFEFVGANTKVRFRDPDSGKMVEYTKTEILADSAIETKVLAITDPDAPTIEARKTGYKNGIADPHDTEGGSFKTTWTAGKILDYDTQDYNSNFLKDLGLTP